MWYFTWILGVLLACCLGIMNVLRLEAQEALAREHEAIDPLTHLLAGSVMRARLQEKVDNSKRNGLPFSILYLNLNQFFSQHGDLHEEERDASLFKVANVIQEEVRLGLDIAACCGGNDFLIALPGMTQTATEKLAERLKAHVLAAVKIHGELPVEMAVGVAEYASESDLKSADAVQALLDNAIRKAA